MSFVVLLFFVGSDPSYSSEPSTLSGQTSQRSKVPKDVLAEVGPFMTTTEKFIP